MSRESKSWDEYVTPDEMFAAMDEIETQMHALFARYNEVNDAYTAALDVLEYQRPVSWREAWLERQASKHRVEWRTEGQG